MSRALTTRLRKLEASAGDEDRPAIFIAGDLTPHDKRLLFTDWRAAVAKGVAKLSGGALYVTTPSMTTEEWLAKCSIPPPEFSVGR